MYEVKVRAIHDTSGLFSQGDVTDRPCPAITVGLGGLNAYHYKIEYYLSETMPEIFKAPKTDKPPYRVPAMEEIRAVPWNGFNAISTFSGCGGSSLGYRMAGFRVLWASEFIEAARDSYSANKADYTVVDGRDIRQVAAADVLGAIGMNAGELDLLDGSPPCASFSTAGKREKTWGAVKKYSDTAQRTDDLFFEFARILKGLQPKTFVAENVSGLVKGTAKGYFKLILKELKECGYKVSARVLDAAWLGVPQSRQRLIFIGVRDDLGADPVHPKPLPYQYTVRDALPWIVRGKFGEKWQAPDRPSPTVSAQLSYNPETSHQGLEMVEAEIVSESGFNKGKRFPLDKPAPVIMADGLGGSGRNQIKLKFKNPEPETDISRFAIGREWDRLSPGQQSEKYFNLGNILAI